MYSEIIQRDYQLANGDTFVEIIFNRPQVANALHPAMLREINTALGEITNSDHRLLLISGTGKNFCAGADLSWMRESGQMGKSQNLIEARLLAKFFAELALMPMPTIALVRGAVYGGAVGIVACCDYALATSDAKFSLSELKMGIVPALIMPYLAKKLHPTTLARIVLTAEVFNAEQAQDYGLLAKIVTDDDLREATRREVNNLLRCAPQAQRVFKDMLAKHLSSVDLETTVKTLADKRATPEAQEGLSAFFAKKQPSWAVEFKDDWLVY